MADFQPPPTWALPIIVDEPTGKATFSPVWLKWFVDLTAILNAVGGGGGGVDHNLLSGLQGGVANQYYHATAAEYTLLQALLSALAYSTYTPTLTNVANLAASTAYQCQYLRVGSVVIVSGKVDVDPTAPAVLTRLGLSLPVASNIGAAEDVGGTAFASAIAGQGAAILGDAANNRAELSWISGDITNQPMFFSFAYRII